jgi:cobalamin synthase
LACASIVTYGIARMSQIGGTRAMQLVTMSATPATAPRRASRATRRMRTIVATSWGAVAAVVGVQALALPWRAMMGGVAGCAFVALVCGYRFHVRAGGLTGDFLGATEQLCECALLLALACVVR